MLQFNINSRQPHSSLYSTIFQDEELLGYLIHTASLTTVVSWCMSRSIVSYNMSMSAPYENQKMKLNRNIKITIPLNSMDRVEGRPKGLEFLFPGVVRKVPDRATYRKGYICHGNEIWRLQSLKAFRLVLILRLGVSGWS
jgi:hypothetical protein